MSCDVLRNLSCIVLRVMRENHRRGQKPGNPKAGEGEGNNNTGAHNGRGEGEGGARGRVCNAHCTHSACTDRGGKRRTEGRG